MQNQLVGGGNSSQYDQQNYDDEAEEMSGDDEGYEDNSGAGHMVGSRQSSSIGINSRSQNPRGNQYGISQGSHTRKSGNGGRSIYDAAMTGDNVPSGIPIPQRGTTTDRSSRGLAKNQNQYNYNILQQNSSNIPVSTQKKKGANSSYVHGGPPRGNMSSYVGSMSGSL